MSDETVVPCSICAEGTVSFPTTVVIERDAAGTIKAMHGVSRHDTHTKVLIGWDALYVVCSEKCRDAALQLKLAALDKEQTKRSGA